MKTYAKVLAISVLSVAAASCGADGGDAATEPGSNGEEVATGDDGATDDDAAASDYPDGTVTLIVPYSAGGPSDLGVRALAPCLQDELGGNFVVENRPGGAGATAMNQVLQSAPDGHTLGVGTQSVLVTTPIVAPTAGYEYTDFTHMGSMMEFPSVVMVHPDSEFESMEDLLEHEGNVTVGTSGSQVSFSLAVEQLIREGYPFTVVPFDGTAEANTAALGRNVDARWEGADEGTLAMLEDGQMRPLAVGTEERLDYLPDVPSVTEYGITGLIDTRTFYPVVAPADVPDDVAAALTEAVEACVGSEEFRSVVGDERSIYVEPNELNDRLEQFREDVTDLLG
jgi:tripartite-type tricarboxylate transporter receptor subunit TctC